MNKTFIMIVFFIMALTLYFYSVVNRRREKEISKIFANVLIMGGNIVLSYTLALFIADYFYISLFNSILFISMDWMLYFLLSVFLTYTKTSISKMKRGLLIFILSIDSLYMLVNPFYEIAIGYQIEHINNNVYFSLVPDTLYYIHLAICYLIAIFIIGLLINKAIKSSAVYRQKYYSFLFAFLLTIIINAIYIFSDFYIDFSVLSYVLLALMLSHSFHLDRSKRMVSVAKSISVDQATSGFILYNEEGKLSYCNQIAKDILGDIEDLHRDFILHHGLENDKNQIEKAVNDHTYYIMQDLIYDKQNRFVAYNISIRDVTEMTKLLNERVNLLSKDPLTSLDSRVVFIEKAKALLETNKVYTFVIVDIEHFKLVNDLMGHEKGDEVLCNLANNLKNYFGDNAIFTRLQSDHFLFMVEDSLLDMDELDYYLTNHCLFSDENRLRFLYGIYINNEHNQNIDRIIESANMAVHNGNWHYLNKFFYYDASMRKSMLNEREITKRMETALKNEEFILYVQPQYELPEKRIVGGEVLVRWDSPTHGIVPPDES